ncbi:hypothetical protein [Sphingobium baderi]|nr:hypothetical protein [Sphingobium baderi]
MMFTQLNPPIPVNVIGKGAGYAIGVIDYGQEHNLIWVTAISETGEIWCAPNPVVRMTKNWTMDRPEPTLAVVNGQVVSSNGSGTTDCA